MAGSALLCIVSGLPAQRAKARRQVAKSELPYWGRPTPEGGLFVPFQRLRSSTAAAVRTRGFKTHRSADHITPADVPLLTAAIVNFVSDPAQYAVKDPYWALEHYAGARQYSRQALKRLVARAIDGNAVLADASNVKRRRTS